MKVDIKMNLQQIHDYCTKEGQKVFIEWLQ